MKEAPAPSFGMEVDVDQSETLIPRCGSAKQSCARWLVIASFCLALLVAVSPAFALDGCLVLLCLAAPNWRAIPQCVPPIRQLLRDLARGRAFPTCASAGSPNTASHRWAAAPTYCPPQYTREAATDWGVQYSCDYAGAISVTIDGALWARTWWNLAGDSVTEFTLAAKTRLGMWPSRFDEDYAAWLAALPPTPVPCVSC